MEESSGGGGEEPTPAGARERQVKSKRRIFDWISNPRIENITPFQQFIVDVDWTQSPLGPMKDWPPQLRQMVLLVVQDPSPAVVYWGDEATIVYNEAYTHLIGKKHPALQGADPKIGFAEVWSHFEKLLSKQRETAETTVEANACLLLHRYGFLEETYFSWKFVPIIGNEGWVVGSHATVVEVTRQVISDRRLKVARDLSQRLSGSKSIKDLWSRILASFEDAGKDIPLAILYTVADTSRRPSLASKASSKSPPPSRSTQNQRLPFCTLEGAIGIPTGHPAAPETIDLDEEHTTCVATALKQAFHSREPIIVPVTGEVTDEFKGIKWRGHKVPPSQLIAYPIIPTDSIHVLGFLTIALNPHRPYDDDYRSFLHMLTQQVTQPQLSSVIFREEVERRQALARQEALDRARLTRELSESETKFARFAARAPIGLAILTSEGMALFANTVWRDLTQLEIGDSAVDWDTVLADGQLEAVTAAWDRLITERKPITMQTRMKRLWVAPELDQDGYEQWTETEILLAMYPDTDEKGDVFSVMSCITDVSELKWNEIQLQRKMDQAIEVKQQQERFIDMTSHEMRNPLSALIGCADEIIASLAELRTLMFPRSGTTTPQSGMNSRKHSISSSSNNLASLPAVASLSLSSPIPISDPNFSATSIVQHLLDESIEAADTIIYCAMHQKRIIDDILTLSRLDSNLLLVSPEPSQPIPLIRSALKMFEVELKRASTVLTFNEDESLSDLDISWTLLDPSRVLQVLINLMTNAIKFTRTEPKREITVAMAASLSRPSEKNELGVKYVARGRSSTTSADQTSKSEWGDGEVIYLSITVTDTGRGLSEDEIKNLFHLFAQASPKTHQTYGGSGLGLFISTQLVSMQGGEIGVQSQAGKGSTFTFYVKTRRTLPETELDSNTDMPEDNASGTKADRKRSLNDRSVSAKSFELLARADALREACAVDISTLQNGIMMPNWAPEQPIPPSSMLPALLDQKLSVQDRSTEVKQPPRQFHILVVEDNLVNQKVVSKQLRKHGHVVSVANHGEEALGFIRRSEFWVRDSPAPCLDEFSNGTGANANGEEAPIPQAEKLHVVLMDLEMPVMDGLTCVRRIREFQNQGKIRNHIPVIAVTANARKDQIIHSYEAGMDDVTTKPYRMVDMLKQIERLVARNSAVGVQASSTLS